MHRSSELIGAIAAAVAKAQAELSNPQEITHRNHCAFDTAREWASVPLCAAVERPRSRAQEPGPQRDRARPDDLD